MKPASFIKRAFLATPLRLCIWFATIASAATNLARYYTHEAVLDKHSVIAPWHHALNGQCDYPVRIAAETFKRYPWTTRTNAIAAYPAYVFSGFQRISSNGVITPRDPKG